MMRRVLSSLFLILAAGLDSESARGADYPLSLVRHANGDLFFDIEDSAPPPSDRAARPRHLRVYFDHSPSRADDDFDAELTLLRLYLDAVHPGIVDVVLLSGGAPDIRVVEAPGEAEQLANILGGLDYEDRASAHDILDVPLPHADACLLFSDGIVPVDPAQAERVRCPLFVVSSVKDANRGLLRVLARRGAGAHLDLSTTSADEAVARMTGSAPRVLGVTSSEGYNIDYALLPSGAGRFRIAGPLPPSGGIVVTLAGDAKKIRTYATKGLPIWQDDGIGAWWAADRLHDMAATTDPDSKRISALAERYSLDEPLP